MAVSNLQIWRDSEYAQSYFSVERQTLVQALKQAIGPSVLQIGDLLDANAVKELDLPFLVHSHLSHCQLADSSAEHQICADPAYLPFADESFSTLILPHVLELNELPHQVLREAHRVLLPEGYIVLSGFNPYSFLGWQRYIHKRAVAPGRYYSCRRVMDWLQLLGFEVTSSALFQFTPLLKSQRLRRAVRFWEVVGDRWLPMTGGGYMITAKKRVAANILIGKRGFKKAPNTLAPAAAAKSKEKS